MIGTGEIGEAGFESTAWSGVCGYDTHLTLNKRTLHARGSVASVTSGRRRYFAGEVMVLTPYETS